jgi:hypothetical protein
MYPRHSHIPARGITEFEAHPWSRRASRQLLPALLYLPTSLWVAAQTGIRDVQDAQVLRRPGMAESSCVPAHQKKGVALGATPEPPLGGWRSRYAWMFKHTVLVLDVLLTARTTKLLSVSTRYLCKDRAKLETHIL